MIQNSILRLERDREAGEITQERYEEVLVEYNRLLAGDRNGEPICSDCGGPVVGSRFFVGPERVLLCTECAARVNPLAAWLNSVTSSNEPEPPSPLL